MPMSSELAGKIQQSIVWDKQLEISEQGKPSLGAEVKRRDYLLPGENQSRFVKLVKDAVSIEGHSAIDKFRTAVTKGLQAANQWKHEIPEMPTQRAGAYMQLIGQIEQQIGEPKAEPVYATVTPKAERQPTNPVQAELLDIYVKNGMSREDALKLIGGHPGWKQV